MNPIVFPPLMCVLLYATTGLEVVQEKQPFSGMQLCPREDGWLFVSRVSLYEMVRRCHGVLVQHQKDYKKVSL